MKQQFKTAILLAGTAAMAACAPKAPEVLPPPPEAPAATPTPAPAPAPAPTGPSVGSQAHFESAVNGQNVIYFETDRFNIDTADAAALQSQAQYLARYPQISITVEGHADERGTREYNLALGERRANSAKNYLVGLGVDPARVSTVSYGKERPVALGSNEQAWAQNRRAVSVVVN